MSLHLPPPPPGHSDSRPITDLLVAARRRLLRLSPAQAYAAVAAGALLVDMRPRAERVSEGEVPGALIVFRSDIEWRLDPACEERVPEAAADLQVVVLGSVGYNSSLLAAALQDLGVHRATDVVGGFREWQAAGLPVTTGGTPDGGRTPAADPPTADPRTAESHTAEPVTAEPATAGALPEQPGPGPTGRFEGLRDRFRRRSAIMISGR